MGRGAGGTQTPRPGDSRYTGPRYVGISVQLEVLARLLAGSRETAPPKSALDQLDRARALVRPSLADARTSIWDLRSEAGGAPKPPDDLPSRLSRHCTRIAGGSTPRCTFR